MLVAPHPQGLCTCCVCSAPRFSVPGFLLQFFKCLPPQLQTESLKALHSPPHHPVYSLQSTPYNVKSLVYLWAFMFPVCLPIRLGAFACAGEL